ncbi:MAG: sigma-70 family RNA polymerase sigma factor [Bacteroidetes bacterium]|uniref:Sigma-70 family RNA polymerase sigma factor n=1 Tax=Candidatus Cryptobacteroides faecipullorum TaxID=2840764 RepID=A0A9D9NC02_9BACT|nr:sigma-70 family RNA polymerase sigma factor [Candidatus Cryptobacteroides faecipullorum]
MGQDRELQLVTDIRKGDRSAMSDLYRYYIGYLRALCSRYVTDDDDVNDILQSCFIKIFTSMDRFQYRGQGSLKAWISRITVNESLRFLHRNRKDDAFKDSILKEAEESDDADPEVEDIPADVLQQMIRDLPDGYRSVFNLYVLEEKSHREIAEMLGITESTSASQFHRAKKILAARIKEYRKRTNG